MKTFIFILILFFTSCSKKTEMYELTDFFVKELDTEIQSYGLLSSTKYQKKTSDSLYSVTPIGRLINVKIMQETTEQEYNDLKEDLESHYKDNKAVQSVYVCQAGTIMIDCRN